jgi:hypothetical protein
VRVVCGDSADWDRSGGGGDDHGGKERTVFGIVDAEESGEGIFLGVLLKLAGVGLRPNETTHLRIFKVEVKEWLCEARAIHVHVPCKRVL